jgi:hypothetical protein
LYHQSTVCSLWHNRRRFSSQGCTAVVQPKSSQPVESVKWPLIVRLGQAPSTSGHPPRRQVHLRHHNHNAYVHNMIFLLLSTQQTGSCQPTVVRSPVSRISSKPRITLAATRSCIRELCRAPTSQPQHLLPCVLEPAPLPNHRPYQSTPAPATPHHGSNMADLLGGTLFEAVRVRTCCILAREAMDRTHG